jgi:hypothetical protein
MLNIRCNVDIILLTPVEIFANFNWLFSIIVILPFLHRARVIAENALGNYVYLFAFWSTSCQSVLLDSACT